MSRDRDFSLFIAILIDCLVNIHNYTIQTTTTPGIHIN